MNDQIAIVLKSYPLFEKDMVVELFTKEMGRLNAFVKYAQSNKPRFGGLLQSINKVKVSLKSTNNNHYLTQVSLVNSYSKLKTSFIKINKCYTLLNIVRSMTQLNQENEVLYDVLSLGIDQLDISEIDDVSSIGLNVLRSIIQCEGIGNSLEIEKYSEKELLNMIESYTHIPIKESS